MRILQWSLAFSLLFLLELLSKKFHASQSKEKRRDLKRCTTVVYHSNNNKFGPVAMCCQGSLPWPVWHQRTLNWGKTSPSSNCFKSALQSWHSIQPDCRQLYNIWGLLAFFRSHIEAHTLCSFRKRDKFSMPLAFSQISIPCFQLLRPHSAYWFCAKTEGDWPSSREEKRDSELQVQLDKTFQKCQESEDQFPLC